MGDTIPGSINIIDYNGNEYDVDNIKDAMDLLWGLGADGDEIEWSSTVSDYPETEALADNIIHSLESGGYAMPGQPEPVDEDDTVESYENGDMQFRIDRDGHVKITGNGKSVYLQGDEAADFHDQIEGIRSNEMDDFLMNWLEGGEQVNELGKATLGSYVKKAAKQLPSIQRDATTAANAYDVDKTMKAANRRQNRVAGVGKAVDKLTKEEQMREWSNSVGAKIEDRGTVMAQPDGETVDLSLRRYLDAEPHNVKVVEAYNSKDLIKEYKSFKGKKKVNEISQSTIDSYREKSHAEPFHPAGSRKRKNREDGSQLAYDKSTGRAKQNPPESRGYKSNANVYKSSKKIDEISNDTVNSYAKKSFSQANAVLNMDPNLPDGVKKTAQSKLNNRKKGIKSAGKRLGQDTMKQHSQDARNTR